MLKTKTITSDKATLLVVELPEGAHGIHLFNDVGRPYISYFVGVETHRLYLEQFGISEQPELLSRLPDITEERAGNILDQLELLPFADAMSDLIYYIKKEGVYFDNPVKHPRQMNMQPASFSWYKSQVKDHKEAQSKVWDRERTYILTKVD